MKKMNKLVVLITLLTIWTPSIQSQECTTELVETTEAYSEGLNITKISAYVPVAALILAALLLSRADKRCQGSSYRHSSSYSHQGYDYYDNYSNYSYYPSFSPGYHPGSYGTGSSRSGHYSH
jgi:hypothetical protein